MKATSASLLQFLLLPVFFVLHGYIENYPFVPARAALALLLLYLMGGLVIYLVSWPLLRSPAKAAVFTFIILAINFFFGSLQDMMKSRSALTELSSYRILLPVIVTVIAASFAFLRITPRRMQRVNRYLFLLMLVLIPVDVITGILKISKSSDVYSDSERLEVPHGKRPDIYFILLDSYAGNHSLKEICHYDNTAMTDALRSLGFYVCESSRSNYNFTPFSMASALNMRYLTKIKNVHACDAEDYANCAEEIKNNLVTALLSSAGYEIVNYSVFDLRGQPSVVTESYLPLKTRLISDQTLLSRMKKDLLHLLILGKYAVSWLQPDIYATLHNNEKLISLTLDASARHVLQPRFIYTHLYMPHAPYYYDSAGKVKSPAAILNDVSLRPEGYVDNLRATNIKLIQIVKTIMHNTGNGAVIILAGDHGFRGDINGPETPQAFNNLHAVFLPNENYRLYYDSLSNVNLFPTIFNSVFDTHFPLLKDSTVYLRDRK